MAWWDLTVNSKEETDLPFRIDYEDSSRDNLIVIDGFYIYRSLKSRDRNLYVNDYRTDIDCSVGLNVFLFYFKNKIYVINSSVQGLSGAIYRFQPTEPYLIKEKDLYKQIDFVLDPYARVQQYGQDVYIFAAQSGGIDNQSCSVCYIEDEEIKTMRFSTDYGSYGIPHLIYINEKYLKNPELTESGIYYLMSSGDNVNALIMDDSGQSHIQYEKCYLWRGNGYTYAKGDTIFFIPFESNANETYIGYYSFNRVNNECKVIFNNIVEYSSETAWMKSSLIYCEDMIDKQNFNVYICSGRTPTTTSILKFNFGTTQHLPITFNIDTNGLNFQYIIYVSDTLGNQTTPPFQTFSPITKGGYYTYEIDGLFAGIISFDNHDEMQTISRSAKISDIQIDGTSLVKNGTGSINISSGIHTIKLIGEETVALPLLSINVVDENNDFTLYDVDLITGAVGKKNPDVFKDIFTEITTVAAIKREDYYLLCFMPADAQNELQAYYGVIKYNNPATKISSITIDGQKYPYQEPDGIMAEGLSINKTTNIYLNTPSLKPVAIINPDGQKTYARVWSTNLPTKN